MPCGSSVFAIGAALVVLLAVTRGDGKNNVARLKVDRHHQVIRRTRQLRSSAMANAAPNARVYRARATALN